MTAEEFRRLALSLAEVAEGSHQGHADFRVRGKIFASLGPDPDRAMIKLPLETQELLLTTEPEIFAAANGAWGRQGCTLVHLSPARKSNLRQALEAAWRAHAPEGFAQQHPDR